VADLVREALISIKPQYADAILDGRKTVELRRGRVRFGRGTMLWIYSTLPRGQIEGVAIVGSVVTASPDTIWSRFRAQSGISRQEFDAYARGRDLISAIVIEDVVPARTKLSLRLLRSKIRSFHPPQFMARVDPLGKLKRLLASSLPEIDQPLPQLTLELSAA
jgi:predicted transcriptional regulator